MTSPRIESSASERRPERLSGNQPDAPGRRTFLRKAVVGAIAFPLSLGTLAYFYRMPGASTGENMTGGRRPEVEDKIRAYYGVLSRDLQLAWKATERELEDSLQRLMAGLRQGGEQFSAREITRVGIAGLIVDMARDLLDQGNRADAWFEQHLMPYFEPYMNPFSRDLRRIEEGFENEFTASFDRFHAQTAALLSAPEQVAFFHPDLDRIKTQTGEVFARRGIKWGAGTGLGLGLAGGGLILWVQSSLAQVLFRRIKGRLLLLLRPVARRVAARMGASLLTAKLPPVAIVVAALGTVWTGYDVYALRRRARNDFHEAMEESLKALENEIRAEISLPFIRQMVLFQENEDALREEIVQLILMTEGSSPPR